MDDAWPLSAAATALLRDRKTKAHDVLVLTLKELVATGAWSLTSTTRKRWYGGQEVQREIRPTGRPVAARRPLPQVDAALRRARPQGGPLGEVVQAAATADRHVTRDARAAAVAELVERRLVTLERRLVGSRMERTPSGGAWAAAAARQHAQWRLDLEAGPTRAGQAIGAATTSAGLLLVLDHGALAAFDREVRRARSSDGGGDGGSTSGTTTTGTADVGDVCWDDLTGIDGGIDGGLGDGFGGLDGLSGLDSAVDSSVSSGDSGGGGDGGGGGGGD